MNRLLQESLKELIGKQLGPAFSSMEIDPVGGGSINDTYRLTLNVGKKFFLKINSSTSFPRLFEKEKSGLAFLAKQNCILTPAVQLEGIIDDYQLLLLEWIEKGIRGENFWKKFGEELARLHKMSHEQYGFWENNYMGSLPQMNSFADTWSDFFTRYRLQPQIELAISKGLLQKNHIAAFESLFRKIDSMFDTEKASLLHGDLWSGNFMCNERSEPVLIDPAIYFGHRSMDLAMTTLFGGFDRVFYDSYNYHFPFPSNYEEQWEICNLYPLLIHLNLFGSGYLGQIERTLRMFN